MKVCFGLLVIMFCQDDKPAVVGDFCSRYERQILSKADSAEIKTLSKPVRDRINGNDLDYYCNCPSPKPDKICEAARRK